MIESTFTWIDYSENDKEAMLQAISSLGDREIRDELGIGAIRDGFSDLLFPGTSTIQTRARYFLFVPWLCLSIEGQKLSSSQLRNLLRAKEGELMKSLSSSSDPLGTIGRLAGASVQRLPSSIYWNGVNMWGIRMFPGSLSQYLAYLANPYYRSRQPTKNDDGDFIRTDGYSTWHLGLPLAPKGFPASADFTLLRNEAEYLRDRVIASNPSSFIAFLLASKVQADASIIFPWEHPDLSTFPEQNRTQLEHARHFSELMHGASLLYNLMLAEKIKNDNLAASYRDQLDEWINLVGKPLTILGSWDIQLFWKMAELFRVSVYTKRFVQEWYSMVTGQSNQSTITDNVKARRLILEREHILKGNMSRLENQRALELWSGEAGIQQLDFRWGNVKTILRDIVASLR